MNPVLTEVAAERSRQDAKWGQQDHPDYVTPVRDADRENYVGWADLWKKQNEIRVRHKVLAWDGVLLEEMYEALSEDDPARLRAELIQVAAVAVAWVEAIDRRKR